MTLEALRPGDCPSEAALTAFFEHRAPPEHHSAVSAHVTGCAACRALLAALAAAQTGAPNSPGGRDEPLPSRVGRYVIERELGRGSMGRVFLANDDLLSRRVALKLVGTSVDDEGAQRLINEARAAAQIAHPNVVAIFDVVEHGRQVYLAMEYIDGHSLQQWLERPRAGAATLEVFAQAAAGLAAIHASGVIHRDFKPANVLIGRDGRVCVTDFGLAVIESGGPSSWSGSLPAPGPAVARPLRSEEVVGTPAYMSPGQFSGGDAGPARDQFAFCVALYEALSGARPFSADTLAELRATVEAGVTSWPAEIPTAVAAVLKRGLAPSPEARFADLGELHRALLTAIDRPRRRRRAGLAAAAVLGLLVFLFVRAWSTDECGDEGPRWREVTAFLRQTPQSPNAHRAFESFEQRWRATWTTQCRAHGEHALASEEWRRVQGCLDAALDDVDIVSHAAALISPPAGADLLLQYVARPEACVGDRNLARQPLPREASGRDQLIDAYRAFVAIDEVEDADPVAALQRAGEAVASARASGHRPTEARATLVRYRIEFNLSRRSDAQQSLARARELAQSSGAARELAQLGLIEALQLCATDDEEGCKRQLLHVRPLLDALRDPWLETWATEMQLERPAGQTMSQKFQRSVTAWAAVPGARRELDRARRGLLDAYLIDEEGVAARELADALLSRDAPLRSPRDVSIAVTRAEALALTGEHEASLAESLRAKQASRQLGLTRLAATASLQRADELLFLGRPSEASAEAPADSPEADVQHVHIVALLELGRWAEAADALRVATSPLALQALTEGEREALRDDQLHLAILTEDRPHLAGRSFRPDSILSAAECGNAAVVLGAYDEARAWFTQQAADGDPVNASSAAGSSAVLDRAWPLVLAQARLEATATRRSFDDDLEVAARLAGAGLMLGSAPPGACGRLHAALEAWPTHRLALAPWEARRWRAVEESKCAGRWAGR